MRSVKLLCLLLALLVTVTAFAACGSPSESGDPEGTQNPADSDTPDTKEETEPPAVDPATCNHNYMTVNSTATCTEGGSNEEKCFTCGSTRSLDVEAPGHTYNVGSLDKVYQKYTKKTCLVCGDVLYEGVPEQLANLTFEYTSEEGIAGEVNNMTVNAAQTANGTYANGKASLSKDKIWILDNENKLTSNNFVFKMNVTFEEFCPEETYQLSVFSILTGTAGKVSAYNFLIKVDKDGYVYLPISGKTTKTDVRLTLGREYEIGVITNLAEGTYDLYLDGSKVEQGTLASAILTATEETEVTVRLFDSRPFKATIDNVVLCLFDDYDLPNVSELEFD